MTISTTQDAEELYGSSTWLCDYIVQHQVAVLKPREVVDFGAGAGKKGRLVRGALGDACTLVAVEGFERSAKMLADQGLYNRVDTFLMQQWVEADAGH